MFAIVANSTHVAVYRPTDPPGLPVGPIAMSVEATAAWLGVPTDVVLDLIAERRIPHVPLTRRSFVIPINAFVAWAETLPPMPSSPPEYPEPAPKTCRRCQIEQPARAFRRSRSRPDGRDHVCKACHRRTLALRKQQARERAELARRAGRVRRARIRANGGMATAAQIDARVAFYGHRCWMCGGPYEHLDHVIPVSAGGTGWPANLRPACQPCNGAKGARRAVPIMPRPKRGLP